MERINMFRNFLIHIIEVAIGVVISAGIIWVIKRIKYEQK